MEQSVVDLGSAGTNRLGTVDQRKEIGEAFILGLHLKLKAYDLGVWGRGVSRSGKVREKQGKGEKSLHWE